MSEMNMREKLARAIDPAAFAMGGDPEWALRKADAVLDVLAEPDEGMLRAMAESRATDDEGTFPAVMDLIDYSGENKRRTILRQMWIDAIEAARAKETV